MQMVSRPRLLPTVHIASFFSPFLPHSMPPPLSNPPLKLVLEYLDVKKRYHITSRNSALQKIDKTIPFHVKYLRIWNGCVYLEELHELFHEAKEQLVKKYLEGRPNIHVDRAKFLYMKSYEQVPLKLNLIINTLVTMGCSDFRNFLPMIDSRSFPLKKLKLIQEESIDADHPIIHTTEDVVFQFNGENELIKGIEKLQREKLTIQNIGYKNVDAVKIIKDWIKNGRKIGTEYFLCFTFQYWIRWVLIDLEKEFDEFQNDLEGINVQFLAREPRFSIPINPTSKIIIYGTEIQSKDRTVYQLVFKVVSTDE
ncbi:hypothetical protein GCK72_008000 [Caenorhabditis remanei]|uniref:F-box domain-containing protein n=1 Tax=Caenorhabditis remanei TaxID=31234 RepID=A0A6A5HKL2_CAERE|nr:hypothetical protein GCK72_008000 [Caenorhabditis remanei]KAF1768039.1 hypothetical protein GCK72_008000 [Caenorhabditis remanei]